MIPGREYTSGEVLRAIFWTRKPVILLTFVVVTTATVLVVRTLPNRYRSETLILAMSQKVSPDFVRATVTSETVKARLPTISQQILSRSRLEQIIRELNLYPELRATLPIEVVVARMQDDFDLTMVDGADSFRLSYESPSPVLAMQVTAKLAGLFIEENSRDRTVMAEEASSFLESQLEDVRRRLEEQEKRLETYRLQYGPELPARLQSNMQAIQTVQAQLQAVTESINRDRDRRLLIQRQLADLQSEEFLLELGTAATPSAGAATSAAAQLDAATAELKSLEVRLTAVHPDLVHARARVRELEARVAKEAAEKTLTPAEILRRNKTRELQASIDSLDREIATRTAEQEELRKTIHTYQAHVEAVPSRESDLASITRDYDSLQTLYRTLLAKREDSKIAENLERRQVGEQFKILDPPRQPERPFWPNRKLLNLGGAVGGLMLGILMAAMLEYFDKSLKVPADIAAVLNVPVMAMIPAIMSASDRQRARRRWVELYLGILMAFAIYLTAAWLSFRS
jgi:polysaccharide chain length determinant protein (PEP-CTERM system associated)